MKVIVNKIVCVPRIVELPDKCHHCGADFTATDNALKECTIVPQEWSCRIGDVSLGISGQPGEIGIVLHSGPTSYSDGEQVTGYRCSECSVYIIEELFENAQPECKSEECGNAGRYSSGYCGVCDLKYNNGQGVKGWEKGLD